MTEKYKNRPGVMALPNWGVITLTAQCEKCGDLFTVWAKFRKGKLFIEPQSRIIFGNGEAIQGCDFEQMPQGGLHHHCGGMLNLFPDLVRRS